MLGIPVTFLKINKVKNILKIDYVILIIVKAWLVSALC